MRNPQMVSLLFLAVSGVFFLFSLALMPPVELYCRFRHPAILLLALQIALLIFRAIHKESRQPRTLAIGGFIFIGLGIALNTTLLVMARSKC